MLTAYGAYGEKQNYGRTVMGVIRSTFVIGPDGLIEQAFYNVKATGHVAKLRRDLGIDLSGRLAVTGSGEWTRLDVAAYNADVMREWRNWQPRGV